MVAGNVFSFIFGRNVDAHNKPPPSVILTSAPNCSQGLNCYVDAFYLNIGIAVLAILLSMWVGYKDRQRKLLGCYPTRKPDSGHDDDNGEI